MVYVDEKEREYEVQYCVILTEGKDAGLKHYVWASEEQIRATMKGLEHNRDNFPIGEGEDTDTTETSVLEHQNIQAIFNKNKISSLEFHTLNEELANFAAKSLKLPLPFPNRLYKDNKNIYKGSENEIRIC